MKIILFEEGGTLIWGGYAYCFYPNFQGVRLFGGLRLLGTLEYMYIQNINPLALMGKSLPFALFKSSKSSPSTFSEILIFQSAQNILWSS